MDALTVDVFSWAPPQPDERTDDFTMLARFLDRLESTSTSVCLATGTSTHPPGWRALIPTSHGLRGPGDTAVHPRSA